MNFYERIKKGNAKVQARRRLENPLGDLYAANLKIERRRMVVSVSLLAFGMAGFAYVLYHWKDVVVRFLEGWL